MHLKACMVWLHTFNSLALRAVILGLHTIMDASELQNQTAHFEASCSHAELPDITMTGHHAPGMHALKVPRARSSNISIPMQSNSHARVRPQHTLHRETTRERSSAQYMQNGATHSPGNVSHPPFSAVALRLCCAAMHDINAASHNRHCLLLRKHNYSVCTLHSRRWLTPQHIALPLK